MQKRAKQAQPRSGKRLVFDIAPPQRLKEVSHELLVPKVEPSRPGLTYLRFGWRFVLVLLLSVWWTTGISPFDMYRQSLKAINGGTEYISLYAQNVTVEEAGLGADLGWQSATNILDAPDLSPEASALEFDPDNSAVWKGGETHLKLSNFRYPELETLAQSSEEKEIDVSITTDMAEEDEAKKVDSFPEIASSSSETASSSANAVFASSSPKIVSSSQSQASTSADTFPAPSFANAGPPLPEGGDLDDGAPDETGAPLPEGGDLQAEAGTTDPPLENSPPSGGSTPSSVEGGGGPASTSPETASTSVEKELIEDNNKDFNDNTASGTAEKTDQGGLLSFLWNKIKALTAKAQDRLFPVRKLNDIGYFESVSLKMSLAVIPVADPEEALPASDETGAPLPEGGDLEAEASTSDPSLENSPPSDESTPSSADSLNSPPSGESTSDPSLENSPPSDESTPSSVEGGGGPASTSPAADPATYSLSWLQKLFGQKPARAETNYSDLIEPKFSIWYRLGPDDLWHQAHKIHKDTWDNLSQGAFLDIGLDMVDSWTDLEQLEIRLKGHDRQDTHVFVDAAWLDVDYIPTRDLPQSKKRAKWEQALELISEQTDFSATEVGELKYKYRKQKRSLLGRLSAGFVEGGYWRDIEISARLINADGVDPGWPLSLVFGRDGEFTVLLPELPRDFKPGRYQIHFNIIDNSDTKAEVIDFYQDFNWGVLALNTNKSVYTPGEEAYLQLAVLDNNGNTVCDADMSVEIISPAGEVDYLTTDNNLITRNPACGRNNFLSQADYFAHYDLAESGEYQVKVLAYTLNGARTISEQIAVLEAVPFDIERQGPTRINPKFDYEMNLVVNPNLEYEGYFREYLPKSFTVVDSGGAEVIEHVNKWELRWEQEFRPTHTYDFDYTFRAPLKSPEFYLAGPAELGSFTELRQWQIAADAPGEIEHAFQDYGDLLLYEDLNYDNQGWTEVSEYTIPSATFTPGDKYLLVVNFSTTATSTAVSSMARLRHGNTEFPGSRFIWSSRQATSSLVGHAYNYYTVWTAAAEDVEVDVSVYNATSSVWVEGFQAFAINLSDDVREGIDWYYATSTAGGLTTSYTQGVTTEIDGKGKDWMILAMAHTLSDSDGPDFIFRTADFSNGTNYNQSRYEYNSANDERPLMNITGVNFTGSSTWGIEGGVLAEGAGDWDYHSIFALNLGKFRDRHTGYGTDYIQITALDTWTEVDGVDPYLVRATGDQIIWSQQVVDVAEGNKALFNRIQVDGTTVPTGFDDIIRGLPYNSTDENLHHNFFIGSLNAGNRDIDVDMYETNDVSPAPAVDIHSLVAFSMMLKAPPTSDFNSMAQDKTGSGTVAIDIEVDDPDDDYVRARLEYAAGTACDFSSPSDPTLNEASSTITADFGTVAIENDLNLQLGSSTYEVSSTSGLIKTASGSNSVAFEWLAATDLPDIEGDYCLRLTARDSDDKDQAVPATSTVYIDTKAPTAPGALSLNSKTSASVTLSFGATSTETNFKEYKIYYSTSSPVTMADYALASNTQANLGDILFNGEATTSISNLATSTTYYFNIWAFDDYGNAASSSQELAVTTNFAPAGPAGLSQHQSGNGAIANGGWVADSGVDLVAEVTDQDDTDELTLYFELIASSSAFTTATSVPAAPCAPTAGYAACGSKIWAISSAIADYQNNAYRATVTPASIPDSAEGYKWQVLACDDYGECSDNWVRYNEVAPNFRTDYTAPTAPGSLSLNNKTNQSITLEFGATTTEDNFGEYKIFYIEGAGTPTENDNEWDQSNDSNLADILFNGEATTTISGLATSTLYTFNIWAYDQAGNSASATPVSAWTNRKPNLPDSLGQYQSDATTTITLGEWHTEAGVVLAASSTDIDLDIVNYYFELKENAGAFTAATSAPAGACAAGTAYGVCASKVWLSTVGSTTITAIPDLDGYKWQVLACDDNGACSEWVSFNAQTPHFKLDATAPTVPGGLSEIDSTGSTITVGFGATTTETYFKEYKIYYATSTPVTEADYVLASGTDPDLGDILFNDTATTVLTSLLPDTEYNISIWAYDEAGNAASSSSELVASTTYIFRSFNWRWFHDEFNETPSYAAAAEEAAPTSVARGNDVKLRLAVGETDGVVVEDAKLRLQYSTQSDFSSDVHFLAEFSSSTAIWTYGDGVDDDDDPVSTNVLSNIGDTATHNESGVSTSTYDYTAATSSEFEFTVRNNLAPEAVTYYFRAYEERKHDPVLAEAGFSYPSLVTDSGSLSYTISGVTSGTAAEGVVADVTTTASEVPFGSLLSNDDAVAIHRFQVETNANNGYQLFVYERQNLLSGGGAQIQEVSSDNSAPNVWPVAADPSAWGYHTSDETLSGASPSRFANDNSYAYFEASAREISYSPVPVESIEVDLVYRLEVSELQEAGEYETEIVYILVPTF